MARDGAGEVGDGCERTAGDKWEKTKKKKSFREEVQEEKQIRTMF